MKSTQHITTSLAALFALAVAGGSQAALTDQLVAYYPLEEGSGLSTADVVGGNNGTLNGHFIATSGWTTGKLGGGLYFNRTGQVGSYAGPSYAGGWIDANGLTDGIGASGVLNDTDSYTMSAWVKFDVGATNSWGFTIFGANTVETTNGNVMRVGIYDDGVGAFAHGTGSRIGTFDFTDEGWHLFTIALGPDGNADFYVDGALSAAKAADTGLEREKLWSTAGLFHFGMEMEGNSATDPFRGTMDEFAIWNRELVPLEISDLYNGGAGVALPQPSAALLSLLGLAGLAVRRRR